jgi:hypothetical protein
MQRIFFVFLILLLTTIVNTPLYAATTSFTGSMDMALTMPNGRGTVTYLFGKGAQRMDMSVQMENIPSLLRTTVLTQANQPDNATIINHQTKSYSQVNLTHAAQSALLMDFNSVYRVTRLGRTTLRGYNCQHIRLQSASETVELWVTGDLGNFSTFQILQAQNPRLATTQLAAAFRNNNIEGFPVKMVQEVQKQRYSMELLKLTKKAIAASQFRVPAGYKRVDASEPTLNSEQKQQLKNLMEKMKQVE